MSAGIRLVPYDGGWPAQFEREKGRLALALAPYLLAVEHIGSTAVAGLAAKPTIDVLAGIYRLSDAPRLIPRMEKLGYEYVAKYEDVLPERRYFKLAAPGGAPDRFHVHMVEVGSDFWERDLLFRDHLRAHGEVARAYEDLKRKLADAHGGDVAAYTEAKTAFVRSAQAQARAERAKAAQLRSARGEGAAPPQAPPAGPRPPS